MCRLLRAAHEVLDVATLVDDEAEANGDGAAQASRCCLRRLRSLSLPGVDCAGDTHAVDLRAAAVG